MNDLNEYFDSLIEYGIATKEEITLVTNINGWNEQTFDNILFARTGYREWQQFTECELEE